MAKYRSVCARKHWRRMDSEDGKKSDSSDALILLAVFIKFLKKWKLSLFILYINGKLSKILNICFS
ncbi:MAG: hypothetical protein U9N35_03600 [Euryarchaeota archaeon]|nr:hypothetical protein [Euryarchaeota archaeon]